MEYTRKVNTRIFSNSPRHSIFASTDSNPNYLPAPEKIAYKVVIPTGRPNLDTFEGWCTRNVAKGPRPSAVDGEEELILPGPPRTAGSKPTYRMTANLRMALQAIDKGVKYATAAKAYGISVERLKSIKVMEERNPEFIQHRKCQIGNFLNS